MREKEREAMRQRGSNTRQRVRKSSVAVMHAPRTLPPCKTKDISQRAGKRIYVDGIWLAAQPKPCHDSVLTNTHHTSGYMLGSHASG